MLVGKIAQGPLCLCQCLHNGGGGGGLGGVLILWPSRVSFVCSYLPFLGVASLNGFNSCNAILHF